MLVIALKTVLPQRLCSADESKQLKTLVGGCLADNLLQCLCRDEGVGGREREGGREGERERGREDGRMVWEGGLGGSERVLGGREGGMSKFQ